MWRELPGPAIALIPRSAVTRLFAVERDKHVRTLLREFLGPAGHTLSFFDDGLSALAAVQESPPDLLILEILVPKLDGLGLCRAVRAAPALKATPVLVLSILSAGDRARLAGADAFMLKPIERGRLVHVVERLLSTHHHGAPRPQEVSP